MIKSFGFLQVSSQKISKFFINLFFLRITTENSLSVINTGRYEIFKGEVAFIMYSEEERE